MKSVMSHNFAQVPSCSIPRSVFDRSHGYKTTFDSGYLVPILCHEIIPGDTMSLHTDLFARLATPFVPVMDNIYIDTFYFFVPNRLVWEDWQHFNGERDNPEDDPSDYLIPQVVSSSHGEFSGFAPGGIFDYFGIPVGTTNALSINALPARAYTLIYNEWFRDENLINTYVFSKGPGPDDEGEYSLRQRGKRHDYFTSCLPWPQKGPGVDIPIGTSAPVYGTGYTLGLWNGEFGGGTATYGSATPIGADIFAFGVPVDNVTMASENRNLGKLGVIPKMEDVDPRFSGLYADLSDATAATINELRTAFQLQKMYERDARGGTRYTEIIRSHFGVISPDARLQRPEYLGGSSRRVNINPVQQTSSTDSTSPQGNLAAYGLCSDSSGSFSKSFTEHGYVIGIINARCDLTYQQGLDRQWSRRTREEFYWPSFAHLGEQPVYNREIYCSGVALDDAGVFGYQERYAEYRFAKSLITGKFRSSDPQSLDVWHLSENFTTLPMLNQGFIEALPPIDRILAVQTEPQFLLDAYFNIKHTRPMPVYGVPGLIDHF